MEEEDTSWQGQCYLNALKFVFSKSNTEDYNIVHGIVTVYYGPNKGHKIVHAWVENETHVFDHDYGTNKIASIPIQEYYALGNIQVKETRRYIDTQALNKVDQYGHCGPWDEMLTEHAINEEGSVYEPV